jgi:hypothetical protein
VKTCGKRSWASGKERWKTLLVADKQFRRVHGYKQIPMPIRELEALTRNKEEVVKRAATVSVGFDSSASHIADLVAGVGQRFESPPCYV